MNGDWFLKDLGKNENGLKVFSCFHCGGGSTMGYKLAGMQVLGGVDIDERMVKIYRENHKPKFSYIESIATFKNKSLPSELYDLDILDGSPPCSSFSLSGAREDHWNKKKKFREGQETQVLDDLFFHFIDLAEKIRPKVVVAENVKGLIMGKAKGYTKLIFEAFRKAGYTSQLFLLNSKYMGVPQARERVFFIAQRNDFKQKDIELQFQEPPITIAEALSGLTCVHKHEVLNRGKLFDYWEKCLPGKDFGTVHPNGSCFNYGKLHPNKLCPTLTAKRCWYHWTEFRFLCESESALIQTFPMDYNYLEEKHAYVHGMSVPPFMTHRIAEKLKTLFN